MWYLSCREGVGMAKAAEHPRRRFLTGLLVAAGDAAAAATLAVVRSGAAPKAAATRAAALEKATAAEPMAPQIVAVPAGMRHANTRPTRVPAVRLAAVSSQ
jgi:hypothetical protein